MTADPAEFVDRNEILPLLGPVKRSGEWLLGFCPVHADGAKHNGRAGQSLGLSDAGVLKCMAGCEFRDIMAALRGPRTAMRPSPQPTHHAPETLIKVYEYKDAAGNIVAEKGRFEGSGSKSFKWRLPGVEGWPSPSGITLSDMPLYHLAGVLAHPTDTIYFVEGEKAADACSQQGLLAVSLGGGAGQREFSESLKPLAGRTVYLWPDNDEIGQAYMTAVRAQLQALDCRLSVVTVRLPPKGDAADYFSAGYSVTDIEVIESGRPLVTLLSEDHIRVVIGEADPVTFNFGKIEKTGRDFDAELSVSCFREADSFVQRINLNSASAASGLRTSLNEVFGKEYGWSKVLNQAFSAAREAYLSQDMGSDLEDEPDMLGEDILLIPPLIVADGATVFFGDGGSFKSFVAANLILCLAKGLSPMGLQSPQLTPLIVDFEDVSRNYKRRMRRLAKAHSITDVQGVHYWRGRGLPFVDQLDAICRYIERHKIGIIFIDSAEPAVGGEVLDTTAVGRFFNALKRLAIPVVVIAHVPKQSDTMKPYGVASWHNRPRRTWYVHRVQEEESDELDVGFYCRKANDGPLPRPLAFHLSFDGLNGPIRITLGSMERTPELMARTTARNQIWAALGGRPRTVKDITEETGLKDKTVDQELRRGPFAQVGNEATGKGGRPSVLWTRKEVFRQMSENQSIESDNPPEGVFRQSILLGGKPYRENLVESEKGSQGFPTTIPSCWRCGTPFEAYDADLRPVCNKHQGVL